PHTGVPVRNTAMRISLVLTVALATGGARGQPPHGETGLVYPLVPGHGGVAPLPRAAEQPRKGAKAVFDVTAGAKAGEVNKGEEVADEVPVADSAMLVLVNKQADGYAYIPAR